MVTGLRHEGAVFIEDPGQTTRHPRAKILPRGAEHRHQPTSHVLATVVANPLDNRQSSGVAHREPFTRSPSGEERTTRRPIQRDVAEDDVQLAFPRRSPLPTKNQFPTAQPLAHEIVGHALQHQLHAGHSEGSEGLAGNTGQFEAERRFLMVQSMPDQLPRQSRA